MMWPDNCWDCSGERSVSLLNRIQYPSDVIALVVLWRLPCRLTLRNLAGQSRVYLLECRGRAHRLALGCHDREVTGWVATTAAPTMRGACKADALSLGHQGDRRFA
jgi:hypothetical protein